MNLENAYRDSLDELGYDLNDIYKIDDDNRHQFVKNFDSRTNNVYNKNLSDNAESLVDSLATLELPAWGYGLRYKFGSLKQYKRSKIEAIKPNSSNQKSDFSKNPLEIQRFDFAIRVKIEGQIEKFEKDINGMKILKSRWVNAKQIKAMAYDS